MKKRFMVIYLILCYTVLCSQDTIMFTSGEQRSVIVRKVGVNTVEYVRFDNQSGATYEILKSDVSKIVYENGVEDILQQTDINQATSKLINHTKDVFIDVRDSKEYKTVKIGKQIWMAENLKFIKGIGYNIGGDCTECCIYYTWDEAKIACPDGWHVPTDKEWMDLEIYTGMHESEANNTGWRGTWPGQAPALIRRGSTGLDLFMCGEFYYQPYDYVIYTKKGMNEEAFYWTGTEHNKRAAYFRHLKARASIDRDTCHKKTRMSVRCIKD